MEDIQGLTENVLSNGDVYIGSFKDRLPHGKGKYAWFEGTIYDGDWEDGKMTGKGKIIWPSGAKYEGDISGGYLHGFGTFNYSDGSIYSGAWRMNIHHGIGRKLYANLNIYDGSWKEGIHEGCGRYFWSSGNSYIGNWKGGQMCGKGIMKWVNGDHFIGFWLNGFRHGSGVYHFADGAYYFGSWSRGLKEGKGTFYPAGNKPPSLEKWHNFLGYDIDGKGFLSRTLSLNSEKEKAPKHGLKHSFSEKISVTGISSPGGLSNWPTSMDENWGLSDPTRVASGDGDSRVMSHASDQSQNNVPYDDRTVYEREYMQGVLIQERIKDYEEQLHRSKEPKKTTVKEARKVSCVNFFESHRSYYLMLNLQLGIRYTVGKITPVPMREVRSSDFGKRARIVMYFPRKGSQFTPPHYSIDFHWKDYCPMVFRNLREMFKLDAAEYMMSICGDDGLRELSSPGKSGSIFYLSHDDRFVIKTLKKSELKVLLKMLPKYYGHVKEHENTLITKFFGLHRITINGRSKVRFVVMGNMFCTELRIHRRYDLKGSTLGRCTHGDKSKDGITMKDLDLSYEFHMDKLLRQSLFKQISLDCMFLESLHIVDYSLLLGVHFRAPEKLKALLEPPVTVQNLENLLHDDAGESSESELTIPPKGLILVTHEPSSVITAPGPHIRGRPLKAYSLGDREVDVLLPGTARFRVQVGANMPAQASHKLLEDKSESSEVELFEFYDVVLYMGIIDILQEYNVKKKLEHAYKSLRFDPLSISVVEPHLYAARFKSFLEKVFHDLP